METDPECAKITMGVAERLSGELPPAEGVVSDSGQLVENLLDSKWATKNNARTCLDYKQTLRMKFAKDLISSSSKNILRDGLPGLWVLLYAAER